jgi:hypothetical protein
MKFMPKEGAAEARIRRAAAGRMVIARRLKSGVDMSFPFPVGRRDTVPPGFPIEIRA